GPVVIAGSELACAAQTWPTTAKTEPGSTAAPRLLIGCCAYSYSKLLGAGKMIMEDVIRRAVDLATDGVDMTGYWFISTAPSYLASSLRLAVQHRVCSPGAAIGASAVQAEAGKRAQVLEEIKKWVEVSESLGAPTLSVFAGKPPAGTYIKQAIEWTVDT